MGNAIRKGGTYGAYFAKLESGDCGLHNGVPMKKLTEIYEQRGPALERARRRLQSILGEVVTSIEDKTLVRAEVTSFRVKGLSSLKRKAVAKGWNGRDSVGLQ